MKTRQILCVLSLLVAFVCANLAPPTPSDTVVITAQAQTSNITLSVPTAQIPELINALAAQYGRLPSETPADSSGPNDQHLVRRATRTMWSESVNAYRKRQAANGTVVPVESDFGSN